MTRKELIALCEDVVRDCAYLCDNEPENTELDRDLKFYQIALNLAKFDPNITDCEEWADTHGLVDFI